LEKKTILLIGLGFYGQKLLEQIKDKWNVYVVEIDREKIKKLSDNYPEVNFIEGDISSILIWKKVKPEKIDYIISTVKDTDIALETCRIAREVFNLKSQIIVILYESEKSELFLKYGVKIIKPIDIVINIILNTIEKNYSKAINIGLGKGEIIEVQILAKSHLVDRLLKYIRPTRWRIAAIYRNGQLVIHSGDERIKVGDTVVLLGEQYGTDAVFPINRKFIESIEEVSFFLSNIKIKDTIVIPFKSNLDEEVISLVRKHLKGAKILSKKIYSISSLMKVSETTGIYTIPYTKLSFFQKMKVKRFFKESEKPFFLVKDSFPYKEIVVSLNTIEPALALEIGIEISRLLELPFKVIYGTLPKEIRTEEDEEKIKERMEIISDFESIYKKKISFEILEGNPVKESVKYLKNGRESLLIVAHCRKEEISFLSPNVTYLLAKKSPVSTLVIPVEGTYG